MNIRVVKDPITREELSRIAKRQFGTLVKAVVDVRQGIMAVGGELHADEEVLLADRENSRREDTWGINLYPANDDTFIEFDSMINIKPAYGNRSRDVESQEIREKIESIIKELVL